MLKNLLENQELAIYLKTAYSKCLSIIYQLDWVCH